MANKKRRKQKQRTPVSQTFVNEPVRTVPTSTELEVPTRESTMQSHLSVPMSRRPSKAARLTGSSAALIEDLPPDNASIPLDRVPYVPGDLLRVAIMAIIMVALIIIGGLITAHYTSSLSQ